MTKKAPNLLARALQGFFGDYLPRLRGMSDHTIHSYRDSLALLLRFVAASKDYRLANLDLDDIGPEEVIAFLNHLEKKRRNSASTRNVRLAAIHAFYHYVASQDPERLAQCQRVLGIPFKRTRQRCVEYLDETEVKAVLTAVDQSTFDGRRDYVLLTTMFNTGARVQEVLDLRVNDLHLSKPFQVRLFGKGRKERLCPLWPETARLLRAFRTERKLEPHSNDPLFLNHRGEPLTRFGVRYILAKYFERAKEDAPSLAKKRLHPHSLRHSTAVHLLKAGVDLVTIGHWLGHASVNTTNKYVTVDLEAKRQAIARAKPVRAKRRSPPRWKDAAILEWLEAL